MCHVCELTVKMYHVCKGVNVYTALSTQQMCQLLLLAAMILTSEIGMNAVPF